MCLCTQLPLLLTVYVRAEFDLHVNFSFCSFTLGDMKMQSVRSSSTRRSWHSLSIRNKNDAFRYGLNRIWWARISLTYLCALYQRQPPLLPLPHPFTSANMTTIVSANLFLFLLLRSLILACCRQLYPKWYWNETYIKMKSKVWKLHAVLLSISFHFISHIATLHFFIHTFVSCDYLRTFIDYGRKFHVWC